MMEPPQNRDVESLHPMFRAPFLAWLKKARLEAGHVYVFVTEARRTEERQAWLWKQGREPPYEDEREVTWTMESRHRWGLAVDVAMQRPTGELVWAEESWAWLYKVVPPAHFGLRSLDPLEWVHLEFRYADAAIEEADALGLTQS